MSDATGTTTTKFIFKTLNDTDIAGNDGINEVITSIDTQLASYLSSIIVLYNGASAPTGWTSVSNATIGLTPSAGYIWIKKNA